MSLNALKSFGTSADLFDVNQTTSEELASTLDLMHLAVGLNSGDLAKAEELEQTVLAAMRPDRPD